LEVTYTSQYPTTDKIFRIKDYNSTVEKFSIQEDGWVNNWTGIKVGAGYGSTGTTIDASGNISTDGSVVIGGDLTVSGTTTTVNTDDLTVKDPNITLNYSTGDSTSTANNAGITIQDAVDASTDASILWKTATDTFDFSHGVNVTGTVTATGAATFGGEVLIPEKLSHVGDTDTHLKFAGANDIRIVAGGVDHAAFDGTIVFNQSGSSTMDFRVESDTQENMLFVDASLNRVGIANNAPASTLDVNGTVTADALTVNGAATITVTDNSDTLTLVSTDADANTGPVLNLFRNSASPANNDVIGRIVFKADDDGGNASTFALIQATATDVSNGSENAKLEFTVAVDDSFSPSLTLEDTGAATFNSSVTVNGSIDSGNITSTGNLTVDVAGDIILDAGGSDITIKDDGVEIANISLASSNFMLSSAVQDKDIIFTGNDGGSPITALTLNMSEAGEATFNSDVLLGDSKVLRFGADQDLRISFDGSHGIIQNVTGDSDIIFKGKDDTSIITALTLDMSNAGFATFNSTVKGTDGLFTGNGDIGLDVRMGTDKRLIFQGNIGEIGDVAGFQAANTAGSANTAFGIRATDIRFATGSDERVRITDSGVGIGEISPSAKFHIKKTAASTQHYDQFATAIVEDTEARLQIVASEGGSNAAGLLLTNEAKHWGVVHHGTGNSNTFSIGYYASSQSGVDISDNLSDILNITTSGYVGLGTDSPASLLNISHATAPELRFSRTGTGQQWVQSIDSNGRLLFLEAASTGGTLYTRMSIDDDGRVGVGAGTVDTKLHVEETTANTPCIATVEAASWDAGITLKNGNGTWEILNDYTGLGTTGALTFYGHGAHRLTITNAGRVGIGTTAPSPDYGSDTVLEIKGSTAPGLVINDTGQGSKYGIHADSNDLKINYGSNTLIAFQNDGHVGIGTSSPAAPLNVAKTGDGTIIRLLSVGIGEWDLSIGNSSTLTGVGAGALELLPLNAGAGSEFAIGLAGSSTPVLHIKSGNVGIGTSGYGTYFSGNRVISLGSGTTIRAPSSGAPYITIASNAYQDGSAWKYVQTHPASNYEQYNGTHTWSYAASGTAGNSVSFSEAMRISGGNLLVGQTSNSETGTGIGLVPDGTSHMYSGGTDTLMLGRGGSDGEILSFNRSGTTIGNIGVYNSATYIQSGSAASYTGLYLNTNKIEPVGDASGDIRTDATVDLGSTSNRFKALYISGAANVGSVTASGNITAYSDERLKENIETLDGSKVMQMRGVSFTKDGKAGSGVIAQELELVASELVNTADDEMGTKSVAYGNLVGYLIENAKQQQAEINELKTLIKQLMEK